jgi:tripartite-type tricarboxylate transporter receptor subunit TctC
MKLPFVLAIATTLEYGSCAIAQVYPSRPITMIVPFPAGGPTDTIGRIIAEGMRVSLGQPVIIENVSGAGGSIGVARVARAEPDGYTLSIGMLLSHVFTEAVYKVQYNLRTDFEPVSLLTSVPLMFVGSKDLPANDVKELIAWLKANPNRGTLGTVGVGSPTHVWGLQFQAYTGAFLQFVPYRGAAAALQDLLAGRIDLTCLDASLLLPHVRSGRIKAYAVLAAAPWAMAPDIPTIDKIGPPGLSMPFWHALWAPKGTPKHVIGKLNAAVVATLADPLVRKRFIDLGQDIFPQEQQNPEALDALQKVEIEKWWPIIKAAGLKAE